MDGGGSNGEEKTYSDELVECLQSVENPGDFACGGPVPLPLPALCIDGVDGFLRLPIGGQQARAVIEQCSRAPYGRGEQTIFDTAVRKTWQLDPAKLTFLNPEWERRLKDLVSQVKVELGCASNARITCKLYKLLLYEKKGGFFKPHRVTEKADGMFGTLIVQLPSHYEGGQLQVKHAGREHTFDFSGIKGSTAFHYAALYADCQHELRAVTKGYRLCLVYNLIYVGSGHCPAPSDNTALVRRTVDAMKEWAARPSRYERMMIALPLDHKYCEASLSFSYLKNLDRAKADLLRIATREVEFDIYLCMLRINQEWSVREYAGYSLDDMVGQEITAECLVSPSGKKAGSVKLDDGMVMPESALDGLLKDNPDKVEVNEATGNEGATTERWYSKAALVLWPKQHRLEVLGLDMMVGHLSKSIDKNSPLHRDSTKWQKYYRVCQKLISAAMSKRPNVDTTAALLTCAIALGEFSLVSTLLGSTLSSTKQPTVSVSHHLNSVKFVDALLLACSTFGWHSLQPCFKGLLEAHVAHDVESCVQFLYSLTTDHSLNPQQLMLGLELALPICKVLVEERDRTANRPFTLRYKPSYPSHRSQGFVCSLLKTLSLLNFTTQLEKILQSFSSQCNRYPLETVLLPAVEEYHQWLGKKSDTVLGFAALCIKALEASTIAPIEEPLHITKYSGTLVVTKDRKRSEYMKQERKTNLRMLSRLRALHEANGAEPSAKRPCIIDLTGE